VIDNIRQQADLRLLSEHIRHAGENDNHAITAICSFRNRSGHACRLATLDVPQNKALKSILSGSIRTEKLIGDLR